uniref:Protein MAIN-LIKE 2-like n=1 Tax=Cicer arietinum TaxID=3827 RepID=A0A1S2XJP1_CICAR|nr:protein MAIN-LIKE 2-like [Cicer arietinum]
MTITLDDVATLLHISPHGKFFDAPINVNTNNAARAAYEYLGVAWEEALAEIYYNKYAQYRLQWLRDLYSRLIQTNQFECAARTYLLHLVGCTIFADKTYTRVEEKYVSLFIELDSFRDYSWATATLVFLYDNLKRWSCPRHSTFGRLHDPIIGIYVCLYLWCSAGFTSTSLASVSGGDREAVPAHPPRACRWNAKHAVEGELMTYRQRLDALSHEDVLFTPYADDQDNHLFVKISMFSEYLRFGGVSVSYLPERCLR